MKAVKRPKIRKHAHRSPELKKSKMASACKKITKMIMFLAEVVWDVMLWYAFFAWTLGTPQPDFYLPIFCTVAGVFLVMSIVSSFLERKDDEAIYARANTPSGMSPVSAERAAQEV